MQVNQPQSGKPEATTPRYDTIVIRGAQGSAVPKEVDGGEVISWSRGHELAGMDALEEFVEDLAAGDCLYPASITERAQQALVLMKLRRIHGWDAEAARGDQPEPISYGELDPVQRLAVCRGTPLSVASDRRNEGAGDHV